MTLNNKKKIAASAKYGFHTVRISHDAFLAVKKANLDEFKNGIANNVGETASNLILAGAK